MFKEMAFKRKHWNRIQHTTWNPDGPGVIRIHLVPPAKKAPNNTPALVFLNGQEILPVNQSWAILLTIFIENINEYGPNAMSEEDLSKILDKTYREVRHVYPRTPVEYFKEDLGTMIGIFEDVIHGKVLPQEAGLLNIGEYAQKMSAPHRMDLMVSSMSQGGKWHCNQKCLHCYAAEQPMAERQELDTESWLGIIEKCRESMIPQLTFTGGEPTLREDLPELIYAARWFVTRLNTNGVLLSKELCQELVDAELDSAQITLYSWDEEIHNRLVGTKSYEKTVQGIRNALEAGLNISINTPLCKENADYRKTLEFLHELGVTYVTCSGIIETGNAKKKASYLSQLSEEEIANILQDASKYCFQNDMEINFTSPGWVSAEALKRMGLDQPTCGACLSNMAITPDGKVVPCQSWLSEEPLGDILTEDWGKIWNKKRCRDIRNVSKKMEGTCPFREGLK